VWLQPVSTPDAMNHAGAKPLRLSHCSYSPMRGITGFRVKRSLHDPFDPPRAKSRFPSRPRRVSEQTRQTVFRVSIAPQNHRWPTRAQLLCELVVRLTRCGAKNDLRSQDDLLCRASSTNQLLQPTPIAAAERQRFGFFPHAQSLPQ
jgi:hypothetical protein